MNVQLGAKCRLNGLAPGKRVSDWREELVVIRSTGIPWPRACPSTAFSRRPMPRETERLAKRPTETELW